MTVEDRSIVKTIITINHLVMRIIHGLVEEEEVVDELSTTMATICPMGIRNNCIISNSSLKLNLYGLQMLIQTSSWLSSSRRANTTD